VISDILGAVLQVLRLYMWVVIAAVIFSNLAAFNVLDTRNRVIWQIGAVLSRLTEPLLRPIRNVLPNFGGIDLSPLVLLLGIWLLQSLLVRIIIAIATGNTGVLFF
jgi:YggT family protein